MDLSRDIHIIFKERKSRFLFIPQSSCDWFVGLRRGSSQTQMYDSVCKININSLSTFVSRGLHLYTHRTPPASPAILPHGLGSHRGMFGAAHRLQFLCRLWLFSVPTTSAAYLSTPTTTSPTSGLTLTFSPFGCANSTSNHVPCHKRTGNPRGMLAQAIAHPFSLQAGTPRFHLLCLSPAQIPKISQ